MPSGDQMQTTTAISLAALVHAASSIELALLNTRHSILSHARNVLARDALQRGCDWLLWIDSDMRFPPDTLARLLAHGQPMVGADYPRRVEPYTRTGVPRQAAPHRAGGLTDMAVMPFGCMLTHADVFLHHVEPPWFSFGSTDDGGPIGEDVMLCRRAIEGGLRIWRDDTLSHDIGHIGTQEFRLAPEPADAKVAA